MRRRRRLAAAAAVLTAFIILDVSCRGPEGAVEPRIFANRTEPEVRTLYHADPNHIWNRVHRHLHSRRSPDGEVFGEDDVDPLLWAETNYLLVGASHTNAIELLDEFLNTHAERLIADPLKRAVFQHDLWAVFDWLVTTNDRYPPKTRHLAEARELEARLARVIRSVALTTDQIKALPDNYVAALAAKAFPTSYDPEHRDRQFLPTDMFSSSGSWVTLNPFSSVPLSHSQAFSHSAFAILINLPGGRERTISYLKTLWDFPHPFVADTRFPDRTTMLNPDLPPFPSGTQLALVRKMLLIDQAGDIVASRVIETMQLRVFHPPSPVEFPHQPDFYGDQDFFEIRFSRKKLFAGEAAGLRAVGRDERDFLTFSTHGDDPLEGSTELALWRRRAVTLNLCADCHRNPGIRSMMSVARLLRPNQFSRWFDPQSPFSGAAQLKRGRHDWGLLQALMQRDAAPTR